MKPISVGNQDFVSFREKDYYFIDKTNFIKEWWESGDIVTLITRPRRFGKTLNMNMLNCFFSKCYEGRADLFEGLSIWDEETYQKLQGTYPVLFLSFADVDEQNAEEAIQSIKYNIYSAFKNNEFLTNGDVLTATEKEEFSTIRPGMSNVTACKALRFLCSCLQKYYGKKVIILLDEYDTPLQEAYAGGYWDEMTAFTRSLFNATFKTNPYLERAVMTGITRVSKASLFSGLNHLEVVTTTSNKYTTAFGFTEEEVFHALDDYGMGEQKEIVKKWYDGFTFGSHTDIYNPWSIINYLAKRKVGTYWANTSSNKLISILLQQGDKETKKILEDLLQGKPLCTKINEEIIFSQLDTEENAIWSLMLASGYLKVLHSEFPDDGNFRYELGVTNFEVQLMLKNMVQDWFKTRGNHYNDFIQALLQNDIKAMNRYMNKMTMQIFSYFDTGNKPSEEAEPERFYHGFVLGLMTNLADKYTIRSNRESGFGRYDVMLKPLEKNSDTFAYILEFKVYDAEDEQGLQDTVTAALQQIQEKQYDAELVAEGFASEQIRHYAFAFCGKEVLIGS